MSTLKARVKIQKGLDPGMELRRQWFLISVKASLIQTLFPRCHSFIQSSIHPVIHSLIYQ